MRSIRCHGTSLVLVCAGVFGVLSLGGLAASRQQPGAAPHDHPQPPATRPQQPPQRPPGMTRPEQLDRIAEMLASNVVNAHGVNDWRQRVALQADVSLSAGERTLQGVLTMQVHSPGMRLALEEGPTLVFDGKSAWVAPASAQMEPGEALRTLQAFKLFAAGPLMLTEAGAKQKQYRTRHFMGQDADTMVWTPPASLREIAGEGGTMLLYAEPSTRMVDGIGSVRLPALLIAGDPQGEAQAPKACAIDYQRMETINGVKLPAEWHIFEWTEAAGPKGSILATGRASNVQFVRPEARLFDRPDGAREDSPAPGAGEAGR